MASFVISEKTLQKEFVVSFNCGGASIVISRNRRSWFRVLGFRASFVISRNYIRILLLRPFCCGGASFVMSKNLHKEFVVSFC